MDTLIPPLKGARGMLTEKCSFVFAVTKTSKLDFTND